MEEVEKQQAEVVGRNDFDGTVWSEWARLPIGTREGYVENG